VRQRCKPSREVAGGGGRGGVKWAQSLSEGTFGAKKLKNGRMGGVEKGTKSYIFRFSFEGARGDQHNISKCTLP